MAQQKAVEAPANDVDDLVDELQPGTKLLKGQYTIVSYINSGGFGITYLAKDSLDRNVVIKECFPSSFCRRSKTMVSARSRAHTAELRSVVQLFVREARHLSKIVHPNIVAVHQVFEDNGTAYMAIDYINGLDLQQIIDGQGRMPDADEIVHMTEKLLEAVGFIHANDMLHRDISPDNVLIDQRGEPILIDFGAAREQASQKSRAMSALRVVKDGYSPQEFYIAGSEQGPWSDLYALGATIYHLISGEAPVNGQARLAALAEDQPDPYLPLAGRFPNYPPGFLAAIDKALNTLPKQRVQSAQEWLDMFRAEVVLPEPGPTDPVEAAVLAMVASARAAEPQPEKPAPAVTAPIPAATAAAPAFSPPPEFARVTSQPRPTVAPELSPPEPHSDLRTEARIAGRSGFPVQLVGGVVAALALVGAAAIFLGGGDDGPATAPAAVAEAPDNAAPVASAAPEAPTETAAAEPAPVEPAAEPAVAPAPVEPAEVAGAPADPAPADPTPPEPAPAEPVAAAPVEPAPEETAAAPAAPETTAAAPVRTAGASPAPNQISLAAWDVEMPFIEENRIIGGQRVAVVLRLLPSFDPASVGPWLANGLLIHSVNGVDVQQSGSITTAVLNAMRVDPDGKARVVVQYSGSSLERQTELMTVSAKRRVSLANGVNVTVSIIDGEWKAVVTGVTSTGLTDLQAGDVLFRDKTTGLALNGATSLEAVMAGLVETGATGTEFSIVRDNRVDSATMQLVVSGTP